jgi:hypothetical protein
MFKPGEVVTARFGMMRDRRLTVCDPGYPSKAVYCHNEYGEEWCFKPDELAYYAVNILEELIARSIAKLESHTNPPVTITTSATIEVTQQYSSPPQNSLLLRALDIGVTDLSIRSTAASIPNVVEE